jgi:hypothetical protein
MESFFRPVVTGVIGLLRKQVNRVRAVGHRVDVCEKASIVLG